MPGPLPKIAVGDTPFLEVQFLDPDGAAVDLTSAEVLQIKLDPRHGTTKVRTAVPVGDPEEGRAGYQTAPEDVDAAMEWDYWGFVRFPDGRQFHTVPPFTFLAVHQPDGGDD